MFRKETKTKKTRRKKDTQKFSRFGAVPPRTGLRQRRTRQLPGEPQSEGAPFSHKHNMFFILLSFSFNYMVFHLNLKCSKVLSEYINSFDIFIILNIFNSNKKYESKDDFYWTSWNLLHVPLNENPRQTSHSCMTLKDCRQRSVHAVA